MNELITERATLLARIASIDAQLATLATGKPVFIRTHKSVRWCGYRGEVYADAALTKLQDTALHYGWVSAETYAKMQSRGDTDGEYSNIWESQP